MEILLEFTGLIAALTVIVAVTYVIMSAIEDNNNHLNY